MHPLGENKRHAWRFALHHDVLFPIEADIELKAPTREAHSSCLLFKTHAPSHVLIQRYLTNTFNALDCHVTLTTERMSEQPYSC